MSSNRRYAIQSIMDMRVKDSEVQFAVLWEGYGTFTWEPLSNITGRTANQAVRDFRRDFAEKYAEMMKLSCKRKKKATKKAKRLRDKAKKASAKKIDRTKTVKGLAARRARVSSSPDSSRQSPAASRAPSPFQRGPTPTTSGGLFQAGSDLVRRICRADSETREALARGDEGDLYFSDVVNPQRDPLPTRWVHFIKAPKRSTPAVQKARDLVGSSSSNGSN